MIGIAYTTRNRVDVLDLCLEGIKDNLPNEDYEFWVIDDCSDSVSIRGVEQNYIKMLEKYPFVNYFRNETRQGISKSKNECLRRLQNCDHIFLMDDDVWATSPETWNFFINHGLRTGINHFLYQINVSWMGFTGERNGINLFSNCGGVFMYMTKKVLAAIGGFDSRMGIYGYDHVDVSQRVANAGLQNEFGPYCSPVDADKYVFSLDLNMNNMGQKVPHRPEFHQDGRYEFVSSLEGEQDKIQSYINENAQYLNNGPIYKEFR